jgi:hypothetical protein
MPEEGLETTEGSSEEVVDLGILSEDTNEESTTPEPAEPDAPDAQPADTQSGEDGKSSIQQDADPTTEEPIVDTAGDGKPAEKFSFLGKEYDTLEAAEQAFKSWDGRIQAETTRRQDAEKRNEEYYRYVDETAKLNQELTQRVAALEGQGSDNGGQPQEPKDFAESLDWNQITNVMSIAANNGEDPQMVGMRMIAEQMGNHFNERLSSMQSELSAPMEAARDADQFDTAAAQLFQWAGSVENDQGEALYPELAGPNGTVGNPEFVRLMYSTWENLARQNLEFAFMQEGVDYAYRLASDSMAQEPSAESVAETGGATPDEPAPGAQDPLAVSKNAAAEAASVGTGGLDPTTNAVPLSDDQKFMKRMGEIKQVRAHPDGPELGFYPD